MSTTTTTVTLARPSHSRAPRTRKNSAPHHLLRITTAVNTAKPVVDLTRLDSPSLASFTPTSLVGEDTAGGGAQGSLRAHISESKPSRRRTQSVHDIDPVSSHPPQGTRSILSLFGTTRREQSPHSLRSPRSSSPSSPVPSISRTHSTAPSSSLPPTPPMHPLPLAPLSPMHRSLSPTGSMPARKHYYSPSPTARRRAPSLPTGFHALRNSIPARAPSPQRSLAALESSSKLMRGQMLCAVCGTAGPDFSSCPGCGDAWCSRACRMAARNENMGCTGQQAVTRGHGCKGKRSVRA